MVVDQESGSAVLLRKSVVSVCMMYKLRCSRGGYIGVWPAGIERMPLESAFPFQRSYKITGGGKTGRAIWVDSGVEGSSPLYLSLSAYIRFGGVVRNSENGVR